MFYSLQKLLTSYLYRLLSLGFLLCFFVCFFFILNHHCFLWLAHSQISIKAPGGTPLPQMWFVPTEVKVWWFCFPVQEGSLLLTLWSLKARRLQSRVLWLLLESILHWHIPQPSLPHFLLPQNSSSVHRSTAYFEGWWMFANTHQKHSLANIWSCLVDSFNFEVVNFYFKGNRRIADNTSE